MVLGLENIDIIHKNISERLFCMRQVRLSADVGYV
jgi:hypothetical protein